MLAILTLFFLVCRFRVQWVIDDDEAFFFAGLGRTGFFYDLKTKAAKIRLFGFFIQPRITKKTIAKTEHKERSNKLTALAHTVRSAKQLNNIVRVFSQSGRVFLRFGHRIYKRLTIEELTVHLIAGFDSPDLTGRATGWYYTLIGAVPSLQNRIRFTPVWDRAEFDGNIRLSIAIPVYKTIIPFYQLIRELPLREMVTIVRENKQRSEQWKTT